MQPVRWQRAILPHACLHSNCLLECRVYRLPLLYGDAPSWGVVNSSSCTDCFKQYVVNELRLWVYIVGRVCVMFIVEWARSTSCRSFFYINFWSKCASSQQTECSYFLWAKLLPDLVENLPICIGCWNNLSVLWIYLNLIHLVARFWIVNRQFDFWSQLSWHENRRDHSLHRSDCRFMFLHSRRRYSSKPVINCTTRVGRCIEKCMALRCVYTIAFIWWIISVQQCSYCLNLARSMQMWGWCRFWRAHASFVALSFCCKRSSSELSIAKSEFLGDV